MLDCFALFCYNIRWWFMAKGNNKVVVGKRQILRQIKDKNIQQILIAANADTQYITELMEAAKANCVKYTIGSSMQELSSAYGIDVPTGAVGVLINPLD